MVLERYSLINNFSVPQPKKLIVEKQKIPPVILDDQSITVTAAANASVYGAFITVHDINDYRRHSSSLLLIPDVHGEIDKLIFDRNEMSECHLP
jgi:hypothetical protein